jgi:hypothetical protein
LGKVREYEPSATEKPEAESARPETSGIWTSAAGMAAGAQELRINVREMNRRKNEWDTVHTISKL